jgi:hypothetical protein
MTILLGFSYGVREKKREKEETKIHKIVALSKMLRWSKDLRSDQDCCFLCDTLVCMPFLIKLIKSKSMQFKLFDQFNKRILGTKRKCNSEQSSGNYILYIYWCWLIQNQNPTFGYKLQSKTQYIEYKLSLEDQLVIKFELKR